MSETTYRAQRETVRDLAKRYVELAFSDKAAENAANWGRLNALDTSARPPVIIDQLPWNEFGGVPELVCLTSDPLLREIEWYFRSELFRLRNFGADLVPAKYYPLRKIFSDTGYGIQTVLRDESEHKNAETHVFVDQLPDTDSLSKLKNRVITAFPEKTASKKALVEDVIGDVIEVRPTGIELWEGVWDRITFWKGAESCLYAVIDEPEFVHELMRRVLEIEMDAIDQIEAQGLLAAGPGVRCHCVETYTDEERYRSIDQAHIKTSDCWVSGAAQIFAEVSPRMHDEFEIEYMKPLYDRFGWVNYGCCEPLDRKIDIIRRMKTVRSISASPWTDPVMQAEAMGGDFVMLRKPNPAYVRSGRPDRDSVVKETRETLKACRRTGTPVAFVLKDLTTVNSRYEALTEWVDIVKAEIENG
ncbi:MAG: hypothetical protein IKX06_06380 [Clostridia bacterium]|nr:hypothetical protein [Clostridia bacterium]